MIDEHEGDRGEVPQDGQADAREDIAEISRWCHKDVVEGTRDVAESEEGEDKRQHFDPTGELHTTLLQLVQSLEEWKDCPDKEQGKDGKAKGVQEDSSLDKTGTV